MTPKQDEKPMAQGDTALERLTALAPERRRQLLDAAESAFAEHGFSRASMNAILKQASMSKGQAYYYVHDKGDLYAAVIDRAFARLSDKVDFGSPAGADDIGMFWDGIHAAFERLSAALAADPALAALGRTVYEGPQTQSALEPQLARIRLAAERLVEKGQSLRAVRSDLPRGLIVDMLFSAARALDRWFAENWEALDRDEARRINREGVNMIRAMIAPPP